MVRAERTTPGRDGAKGTALQLGKWRVEVTLRTAASAGLTAGKKEKRISWRANEQLVEAAQMTSGLEGSELLEYALAKVALEDDFFERLTALSGSVSRDVDLEF